MLKVKKAILVTAFCLILLTPFDYQNVAQSRKRHSKSCPKKCKICLPVIDKALAFLSKNLRLTDAPGSPYPQTTAALAGLAYFARDRSKYSSQIKRILDFLKSYVEKASRKPRNQANWVLGFSGLLFGEAYLYKQNVTSSMNYVIKALQDAQTADGGWGHSKDNYGVAIGRYPRTLFSTTGWCAAALGLLNRLGIYVKKKTLKNALQLLKTKQRGGGYPYDPTQSYGADPGRTSACLLALYMLDAQKSNVFKAVSQFITSKMKDIPEGHASSAMHVCAGAMAFYILGRSQWKKYNDEFRDRILASQRSDGSFKCICKGTKDPTSCEEKFSFGKSTKLYVTAMYCVALQACNLKILNFKGKKSAKPLRMKWLTSFDKALKVADVRGRPVLVYIPNTKLPIKQKSTIKKKLKSAEFVYVAKDLVCVKINPNSSQGKKFIEKYGEPKGEVLFVFFDPKGKEVGKYSGGFDEEVLSEKMCRVVEKYARVARWYATLRKALRRKNRLTMVVFYRMKKFKVRGKEFEDLDKASDRLFDKLDKVPIDGFADRYNYVKIEFHKKCTKQGCDECEIAKRYNVKSAPVILILDPTKKGVNAVAKVIKSGATATSIRKTMQKEFEKFKKSQGK